MYFNLNTLITIVIFNFMNFQELLTFFFEIKFSFTNDMYIGMMLNSICNKLIV